MSLQEPLCLPAMLHFLSTVVPVLAVGMANIPPHNLVKVVDAFATYRYTSGAG